jgi:UDP:flavonoid glycosyltransferase YjiC (YdhE family)
MRPAGLRVVVGATGLAGHALPALALARELVGRGHRVVFWGARRWREAAEGFGAEFAAAPDLLAETTADAVQTASSLRRTIAGLEPDAVVGDALTLLPSLAAEAEGVPRVRLLPEVYPANGPGTPPFSLGMLPPRTRAGSAAWRLVAGPLATRLPSTAWLRGAHRSLNELRGELGLPPQAAINRPPPGELTLVATLAALEHPRAWPAGVHVTGPLFFDLPAPPLELESTTQPLVLVAPSTVKDPCGRLVEVALEALADEPVRVLLTTGGGAQPRSGAAPPNATVVEWVDYVAAMQRASLVVCHGNHGTVVRALAAGVPVVVSPAMADDAEHGARVAWSGAGLMLPRCLLGRAALRATVRRVLLDPKFGERARRIATSPEAGDGAQRAVELIEAHAARPSR